MDICKIRKQKNDEELVYNFLEETKNLMPIPLDKKVNIREFTKKILNLGEGYLARDKDGSCKGILLGYVNDTQNKIAYISLIAIKKKYQGQGIGKKLINEFKNLAKRNGMEQLRLYVHKTNNNAIRFYEKNNFKINKNIKANEEYNITMTCDLKDEFNILITSVGRRGYLVEYFKKALDGKGQVHVANSSNISPAFKHADKSVVTPLIYDTKYIEFLEKYCDENYINMIVSLFDIDLPILSKNKSIFENKGIKVIVSDENVINICNDKWETYRFLKSNNFNTIKTYLSIEDIKKGIKSGEIGYPIIIKPRWGMGSISVLEAENEEELEVFYKKTKKNILNSYLKYESKVDIENCIIFQEKINGIEHGLDVINNLNKEYVNTIVRQKYAMRSGETDCAKIVNNKELKELGKNLSNKLQHIGNLDVDVFVVENKAYVLEMNARFGGGYPFSHIAGVNLPKALIEWCKGKEVDGSLFEAKENLLAHKDINIIEL